MGSFETERVRAIVPAAMLLLAVLFLVGACSDETRNPDKENNPAKEKTEVTERPRPLPPPDLRPQGNRRLLSSPSATTPAVSPMS